MPFTTPLNVRELTDDRWELAAPLVYQNASWPSGFVIPAGFVTDFASVPRWLPAVYAVFGGTAHEAAVLHDYLYQTNIFVHGRREADALFYEAAVSTGINRPHAWAMWLGVRLGGLPAWRSGPRRYQCLNCRG